MSETLVDTLPSVNSVPSVNTSLYDLFEYLLVTNSIRLDLFTIKISEEIKGQLITIIENHKSIFDDIEKSIKQILADDKINSEDIPELLVVIGKLYEVFYKSKCVKKKWDYYKLIRMILHISFVLYTHDRKIENKEMIDILLKIVDSSIDLIQLKSGVKKVNLKFW